MRCACGDGGAGGLDQHEGDCAVNAPQEEKTWRRFAAVSAGLTVCLVHLQL